MLSTGCSTVGVTTLILLEWVINSENHSNPLEFRLLEYFWCMKHLVISSLPLANMGDILTDFWHFSCSQAYCSFKFQIYGRTRKGRRNSKNVLQKVFLNFEATTYDTKVFHTPLKILRVIFNMFEGFHLFKAISKILKITVVTPTVGNPVFMGQCWQVTYHKICQTLQMRHCNILSI